ncbi:MAG: hypothetical protein E6R03_06970 [Hyphomicrobiaceae bacterium]|nr:MAG: hypothetical protein E6R03_06970 [Hyphomicrobiaceae bacterium]
MLEVFAAFLAALCAGLSVAVGFLVLRLRDSDKMIQDLSNTVSSLRYNESTGEDWSNGYNKGRADAEVLYKQNVSFLQEHYGALVGQLEQRRTKADQADLEDLRIPILAESPVANPLAKIYPVTGQLDPGIGSQDISQQLGAFS